MIVKIAKDIFLNHTFQYGSTPSGYFVASKVAKYLQEVIIEGN